MTLPLIAATIARFKGPSRGHIVALLALGAAIGVYFVARYGGRWTESDSGLMAQAIRIVDDRGELAPDTLGAYSNGYGYQAISLAITAFTGLSVTTLQQVVYPVVSALLILPAWTLYRELTGSARAATLSTVLLLLVPEHLFAVLRASHERFDRVFLMIALWLLVRSLRSGTDRATVRLERLLIGLMTFALVATNVLFGMSFAAALATGWLMSRIGRYGPNTIRSLARETERPFGWATLVAVIIVGLFIAFLYPPFATSLRILLEIPGKLISLIMSGGGGFDPYAYVATAWSSPLAFLVLSVMNFVMVVASALIWLAMGIAWLRGRRPESVGVWALWLLAAAFAFQGAVSIVSDRTGSLSGNVQYRAFALFAVVGAPLMAYALSRWHPGQIGRTVAAAAFTVAIVISVAKASLDPAFSNKWLFYAPAEVEALRWADVEQGDAQIWVGPEDRVQAAYAMEVGNPDYTYRLQAYEPPEHVDAVLVSDLIAEQSERLGIAIPPLATKDRLYDNGEVQLFR